MATDFTYGKKQIVSGGPFKPSGKDMPNDARARVEAYADIVSIPNPYVGLKITVKVDETNNNKMTDYIVKSLKANSMGVANSAIDEVVRYVDYLGVSGGSSGGGSGEGLTTEQAQQLQTAYEHSQNDHVTMDEVNEAIANAQLSGGEVDLSTYATKTYTDNAISTALDGHTFKFLTQAEYDDLEVKDPLVEYHITDATDDTIDTSNLASDLSLTGSNLQLKNSSGSLIGTAITLPTNSTNIPTKTSDLTNDSGFVTSSSLSNYVLTSEINGLVEDALQGATVTSKSKVNYSSTAYNSNYNAIEIKSGSAIDMTFSIPNYTTRYNFYLSCSTNDISFSGSGYSNNGFSFTSASGLSKTVTFTAASNITSKRCCYIYVAPYDETANSAYDGYKIRFIISPSSDSSVTYGDIVVNNTTSSINEGQKFTYTINLSQAPTNDQIVNITTTNSDVTVNPTSLTFTSSNYSTAQTVTVDVSRDSDTSSDDCQITMASAGVSSKSFNIQINDIDVSEPEVTSYTITKNLTNVTISNSATSVNKNSSYSATLTANSGHELSTVTVTMGGTDITSSSYSNGTITISNVTGNIVITANATKQTSIPDPDETVATDNLVVHFDGRDVEAGSSQAYWTNRVSDKSISTYEIASQFGTPNTGWNDTSRNYGWLGDSFRYYLVGQTQPQVAISEITENYSISVCLLQENYTNYMNDDMKAAYRLWNSTTGVGNRHEFLLNTDGSINLKFGNKESANIVSGNTFKHALSSENPIIHHTTTVDFTNKKVITYINGIKQSELNLTGNFINPRNLLQLATGKYTVPVKLYYLRIYNTVLTPEQVSSLYEQENSIVRSV